LKSLYLRIWLTVVAALALFALVSGWMWQRHLDDERVRFEAVAKERLGAWAELVHRSLPVADAPVAEQTEALQDWSNRLRVPLALDNRRGERIAASESFSRREADGGLPQAVAVKLDDGRTLWLARRLARRAAPPDGPPPDERLGWRGGGTAGMPMARGPWLGERPSGPALGERPPALAPLPPLPFGLPGALGPLVLVAVLFVAVAAGAFPVVRRLTRRLEALKQGVQAFGGGNLAQRVDASGSDEVAAVAATFNQAAERIETLVHSHQNLLANASHELRSPLARLKMAVAMYTELPEAQRAGLKREIDTNVAELDALVEEVLLASRLEAHAMAGPDEPVDLLSIAAEESSRVHAEVEAQADVGALVVLGSDRLLRRALRNLLENARRYGGGEIQVRMSVEAAAPVRGSGPVAPQRLRVQVCDRGAGVPDALRERIFEPFFRLPGHAEREGGVGLGLSLVRQIVQRHRGSVHCEPREGGGSCFVISLPARPR
jgi:signal transduction histidine kinase